MFFLIFFKSPKSISNHNDYSYDYNYNGFHYSSPPLFMIKAIIHNVVPVKNTKEAPVKAFCSINIVITEAIIRPIDRSFMLSTIKSLIVSNYISFEAKNQYD